MGPMRICCARGRWWHQLCAVRSLLLRLLGLDLDWLGAFRPATAPTPLLLKWHHGQPEAPPCHSVVTPVFSSLGPRGMRKPAVGGSRYLVQLVLSALSLGAAPAKRDPAREGWAGA